MIALYVVPYLLMLMYFENPLLIVLMWVLMGFGMAGIGLSIMHDANHGAFSKNQTVNQALGYIITLVGGHDVNWRIQHNRIIYLLVTNLHESCDNTGTTWSTRVKTFQSLSNNLPTSGSFHCKPGELP